ncbi:interferon-stimulated 20 kDa exonuclease-like 2 [Heteronotia binoei]|uniref:interferon-stimulated 20 kDa exonuclease-like 2 n=1 Tax=Heteronotia binoei TaxID=13085 RepID=UPI00292E470D|nr:interferon-stimulated 20 kDa exonuclease-like 2 [Heteronotia binoei]
MSDIIINLDTSLHECPRRCSEGSKKHQRFVRRRRFLERRGFLKQRQLPPESALPQRDASHRGTGVDEERGKKRKKVDGQGGQDGAGREDGFGGGARKLPKENASRSSSKTSGSRPSPQSEAPAAPSKTGSSSALPNGTKSNCGTHGISRAHLWSEYESGLNSAPEKPSKMVAIDCEMVGTGPGGRNSDLARCSIVGYYGDVMYDKYVRPVNPITNYRTRWSGIRRHHMTNAVPFKAAQKEILKILSGKIVIGHAVYNDFKALKYFHPKPATRDTSRIPLLNRKAGFPENESISLKRLTKQLLHRDIQVGQNGHSSVEDARATMELYKLVEADWESYLASCPVQD